MRLLLIPSSPPWAISPTSAPTTSPSSSRYVRPLGPRISAHRSQPNPYSYDSTVTDPSLPLSPFVQAMREQEELFYAAFPEARKAAEYRERRKAQLRAFLASTDADFQATRVATPYPQDPTPVSLRKNIGRY